MKQNPVLLSEQDKWILDTVAMELGVPRAEVMRWALRYYALYGPWITPEDTLPGEILDRCKRLLVGPDMREVTR